MKTTLEQNQLTSFDDAVDRMREILYKNELYREGSVYITYDRQYHEFHVCESDGTSGISADEYPNSEYYSQIRIIEIDINGLDDYYSECESQQESELNYDIEDDEDRKELSDKDKKDLWESIVDDAISNNIDSIGINENEKAAVFELDQIESGRYPSELSYNEYSKEEIIQKMEKIDLLPEVKQHILKYFEVY